MRPVTLAALLLLTGSTAAVAQSNPQTRDGFTISFGLGTGSGGVTCDGCGSDRQNGLSGYLRMGGAVSPNLVIGGESQGWVHSEDAGDVTFSFLTAFAQYYPAPATGFFLKAGVGYGATSFEITDPSIGSVKLESAGLAGTLGLGYDVRLGKNFSLSPYLNYMSTFGAPAKLDGQDAGTNLNGNVVQLGLGFTWH